MIDTMRQGLTITLQSTISKLGPLPDELGEDFSKHLAGDDIAAIFALGCSLEQCEKDGNWDNLAKNLASIAAHQKKKSYVMEVED